jgi:hypothetical protein
MQIQGALAGLGFNQKGKACVIRLDMFGREMEAAYYNTRLHALRIEIMYLPVA